MVLTDSVRTSWPFFWQTGMNHVFIVNYESLRKYFVRRINKSEKWTLKDVEFHNTIKLFKSVIIDESHKVKINGYPTKQVLQRYHRRERVDHPVDRYPCRKQAQRPYMPTRYHGPDERSRRLEIFHEPLLLWAARASNLKELNFMLWKHCFFRRKNQRC